MTEAQQAALARFEEAVRTHALRFHRIGGNYDDTGTKLRDARSALIAMLEAGSTASNTLQEMVEREVEKAIARGAAKSVLAERQVEVERAQIEVGDMVADARIPHRLIGNVNGFETIKKRLYAIVGREHSCREQGYPVSDLVKWKE